MSALIAILVLCGIAAALALQAVLLLRPAARREAVVSARLKDLGADAHPVAEARSGIARERLLSRNAALDELLAALPGPSALAELMHGAGMQMEPARFLTLVAGLALGLPLLAQAAGASLAVILSLFLVALVAPLAFVALRRRRRIAEFSAQLPDALELLVRTLRAGNALTAGMRLVSEELPDPLASEFALVHEQVKLGRELNESLEALRMRMDTQDVRLLCTSLLIQRETGGNLVEVLENLSGLMRRRIAFTSKLSALTAEGRLSAIVLSALPPGMVGVLFLLNRPYAEMLFAPGTLRYVLFGAAGLQLLGGVWIRSIVKVRY